MTASEYCTLPQGEAYDGDLEHPCSGRPRGSMRVLVINLLVLADGRARSGTEPSARFLTSKTETGTRCRTCTR